MVEPENIVLELLHGIRSDIARMEGKMDSMSGKIDDLEIGQQGLQGVVVGLGHYMPVTDHRVEQFEAEIGGDA